MRRLWWARTKKYGLFLVSWSAILGCGESEKRAEPINSPHIGTLAVGPDVASSTPYAVDGESAPVGATRTLGQATASLSPSGPVDSAGSASMAASNPSIAPIFSENKTDATGRKRGSYEPSDAREVHWLGDGYDALTGERKGSCLSDDSLRFRSLAVHQVFDTMDVASSKEELAQKLNMTVNTELSGTYHGITLSPSLKVNILRETNVSAQDLVAVASFVYVKDRISIEAVNPDLAPARIAQLKTSKEDFRQQCGDQYTHSIRTGAALFVIVQAQQISETTRSVKEVQATFKVALGQLFGISPSVSLSPEQKSILSHFRLSTRCYSDGVSARPCADHQLNITGFNVGDISIFERVASAKKALATEAIERKVTAVLEETRDRYPVPPELRGGAVQQVFYDYRPHLKKVQEWLRVEEQLETICGSDDRDLWRDQCRETRASLRASLVACADQREWPQNMCRSPKPDEIGPLTDLADGGWVKLWDDRDHRGTPIRLDLTQLLTPGAPIRANVLYSLHDARFDLADRLSAISFSLRKGWQLILFEHVDGSGSRWVIQPGETQSYRFPRWFNNKASSFIIKNNNKINI